MTSFLGICSADWGGDDGPDESVDAESYTSSGTGCSKNGSRIEFVSASPKRGVRRSVVFSDPNRPNKCPASRLTNRPSLSSFRVSGACSEISVMKASKASSYSP